MKTEIKEIRVYFCDHCDFESHLELDALHHERQHSCTHQEKNYDFQIFEGGEFDNYQYSFSIEETCANCQMLPPQLAYLDDTDRFDDLRKKVFELIQNYHKTAAKQEESH